jgi:leucyl aminopeptidase
MDFFIQDMRVADCACDVIVLPIVEGDPSPYSDIGVAVIPRLIKRVLAGEFKAKKNEALLLPLPEDIKPDRLLLVGLGKKAGIDAEAVRQAGGKAAGELRKLDVKSVAFSSAVIGEAGVSPAEFVEGFLLGMYTFGRYRKEKQPKAVSKMTVIGRHPKALHAELAWKKTVCSAVSFARNLVNTPANDMTPSNLAKAALSLKGKNLSVTIVDKRQAAKLGMNAYLAVARGSAEPPKFMVLNYRGSSGRPLVLVGKSITFDSGGLSLKPSDGMEKMKYDMAGGAAVLGVLKAASEAGLRANIVGILPAAENLPGGSATRPGDVVKAITGTTVEIANTDAEGRLVMADAIGYAKRFKPTAIIDIATLTGACPIAFGNEAAAMMGNNRGVLDAMKKSSDVTGERVWEMPLFEEYREYLKSDIADIRNIGGRIGSLVTAGYFLKEFAGDIPWAHLDIAGTAWTEKDRPYIPKGASGIGVRLLLDMIKERR